MHLPDYHMIKRPLNNDIYCGDTALIKAFDGQIFLGIIDVLGHGKEAHELADVCKAFLDRHFRLDPVDILVKLHDHIRGSRGAVAGLARVNLADGRVACVGCGDISIRIFGAHNRRVVTRDGIIGYMLTTPRTDVLQLEDGDVLIMHTDGIVSHFDLDDDPGLLDHDAADIAATIMDRFARNTDDALCMCLKLVCDPIPEEGS